jgi:hypothetical protein
MKLEPLMTVHADLKPPVDLGAGPYGTRLVFDVTGGHFEGARLRGTLLPRRLSTKQSVWFVSPSLPYGSSQVIILFLHPLPSFS